jgi:tetratricopeptide (TPR) repeat protein
MVITVSRPHVSFIIHHLLCWLIDMSLATLYLEKYLAIATETKQSVAQVEAYSALGTIWSQQGQHDKAVSFFEKTFEIARTIGTFIDIAIVDVCH